MKQFNNTVKSLALATALIACSATMADARMMVDCTADAKQCPDGSYVSRTGPDCSFAPCPGEGGAQADANEPDVDQIPSAPPREEVPPSKTSDSDGAFGWADKDIEKVPTKTIDLDYLFEHRSALHGETISLRGEIETTRFPGSTSCAYAQDPCEGPNRITMQGDGEWENYKVLIFLKDDNTKDYEPGDVVTITGRISSGTNALIMREE